MEFDISYTNKEVTPYISITGENAEDALNIVVQNICSRCLIYKSKRQTRAKNRSQQKKTGMV
jgi:hypothetical protein